MPRTTTSRHAGTTTRTLSATGALAVAAGTLVLTAGAMSSSASAATISLDYTCNASVFGTTLPQGTWSAKVTVGLPSQVAVGAAIPAPSVTAAVTTSTASGDTMRQLSVVTVDGTSDADYSVAGKDHTAALTIPSTDVPKTGAITTTASGKGEAMTAPSEPTTLPVDIGDFTGELNAYQAGGTSPAVTLKLDCTLVSGQNTRIGTIKVVDDASSSPSDSSTTSSPSDSSTTSSPSDSSTTSSPSDSSTTSSPSDSSTTSTPGASTSTSPSGTAPGATPTASATTGPPIITDGGSAGGGQSGTAIAAGGGLAIAGLGLLTAGLRRRTRARR